MEQPTFRIQGFYFLCAPILLVLLAAFASCGGSDSRSSKLYADSLAAYAVQEPVAVPLTELGDTALNGDMVVTEGYIFLPSGSVTEQDFKLWLYMSSRPGVNMPNGLRVGISEGTGPNTMAAIHSGYDASDLELHTADGKNADGQDLVRVTGKMTLARIGSSLDYRKEMVVTKIELVGKRGWDYEGSGAKEVTAAMLRQGLKEDSLYHVSGVLKAELETQAMNNMYFYLYLGKELLIASIPMGSGPNQVEYLGGGRANVHLHDHAGKVVPNGKRVTLWGKATGVGGIQVEYVKQ